MVETWGNWTDAEKGAAAMPLRHGRVAGVPGARGQADNRSHPAAGIADGDQARRADAAGRAVLPAVADADAGCGRAVGLRAPAEVARADGHQPRAGVEGVMLPYDIVRCRGNGSPLCQDCERRTSPSNRYGQAYMAPQADNEGCPRYVEPVRYTITEKGRRMVGR